MTDLIERLRERIVIGYHSDGYASIGRDKDGNTTYESRPATPMTRLANRDGLEAADRLEALQAEIEGLCEALEELLGSCSRQPVGGGERWRYSKQRMHAHEASCKAIDALRKARILIKQEAK